MPKSWVGNVSKLRPNVKASQAKEALLVMKEEIQKFNYVTIAEAEILGIFKLAMYYYLGSNLLVF
jgi:hypothetical protein